MINQAFIFAAGRGERLRPITDTIPKPLVKVKNKAILDYSIEKLLKITDFEKIIINGFYLASQIEDHIKKLNNPRLVFSRETSKIETGGGLVFAKNKFDITQPILLLNGDILWQENDISDIKRICQAFNSKDCDILLGLKKTADFFGYNGKGDFNFDAKTGDLFRNESQPASHVFVGPQVITPQILKDAPQECFSMNYFYKKAMQSDGKLVGVKGIELDGKYFHIGDENGLKVANELL